MTHFLLCPTFLIDAFFLRLVECMLLLINSPNLYIAFASLGSLSSLTISVGVYGLTKRPILSLYFLYLEAEAGKQGRKCTSPVIDSNCGGFEHSWLSPFNIGKFLGCQCPSLKATPGIKHSLPGMIWYAHRNYNQSTHFLRHNSSNNVP